MNEKKQLQVSAIKEGTVIDHIPANSLFKVISILGLEKASHQFTFGTNFHSDKLGKKAIIKLEDVFFKEEDINKIALVAPTANLNVIKDYKVVEKKQVVVPDEIRQIAKCMNPVCITNHEEIPTRFEVLKGGEIRLKCQYCEKITDQDNLQIVSS